MMHALLAQIDMTQAHEITTKLPWAEILGPLAPVALSPFFGLACLSALSILVSRGVLPDNVFLHDNPVLNNPTILVAFAVLAVFTSLPRLTKVSKPVAQAADLLETYAGLVAILVVQWAARHAAAEPPPELVAAGIGTFTTSTLLAAVSAINFIVVQTVRFAFELLVWVSPFPLVDAVFEACNKIACAGLLAVYAFSPWAAFFLNLLIFLVCLCLFRWARRKMVQFRELLRAASRRIFQAAKPNRA